MLLGGIYSFRPGVDQRSGLKRFQAWTPPEGFTFQSHWARSDGMGGIFLAEVATAAAALEATTTFSDLIEFELVPVVDIMESVAISAKVFGWIDSIG
jgi:hypothetical protein